MPLLCLRARHFSPAVLYPCVVVVPYVVVIPALWLSPFVPRSLLSLRCHPRCFHMALLSRNGARYCCHWRLLALVFVVVSIDVGEFRHLLALVEIGRAS